MALLHYKNLGVSRPDLLMKQAFFGLKTFYDFLRRTRDYMESEAAVRRLAWQPGHPPDDNRAEHPDGVWIQLVEPDDRPNEPEATFREFLNENVKKLHVVPDPDPDPDPDSAPPPARVQRLKFGDYETIEVLDRDPENYQLLVDSTPAGPELLLRPNTWSLACQLRALQALQNGPGATQRPVLRLFEPLHHARWPEVRRQRLPLADWMVLTDSERPGTSEQRRFVEIALATPDFAFLEGPPGSGKTTAICELVLQLAQRGKRVLLCASTHVAVDNVLERIMDERNAHRDLVIPVRIGDRRNVSAGARPWQLERFVRTERERLLRALRRQRRMSESQHSFLKIISHEESAIERLVLDAANLVCGTMIGILQHPDIKKGGGMAVDFDVLIVDEASKTTFQEFLVPALLAKRWIVVGDPKQLSPYVDDTAMAVNVETCLPDANIRNACVDAFLASQHSARKRRTAVVACDVAGVHAYEAQCAARDIDVCTASADSFTLATASIVVDQLEQIERARDQLPLDVGTIRAPEYTLSSVRRRAEAWRCSTKQRQEELPQWANNISWRLARLYEQRFAEPPEEDDRRTTTARLRRDIDLLLPVSDTGVDPEKVRQEIDRVRRVALPSVLESLRYGFERDPRQRNGTAISDGLPNTTIEQRHVLLRTQHRMHPEIAAFSHEHIYDGEALWTPESMQSEREWSYTRYARRAVWLDVRGGFNSQHNANPQEARMAVGELRHFDDWARQNPRDDGRPWEVAMLTFYRGQARELRGLLRQWTKNDHAMRHFSRGPKQRPYLSIDLCTIDGFQGYEADLVVISFASPHPTSFLESPNRLNVALTRARYQRVVVGNRHGMRRAHGGPLGIFADQEPWEQIIEEVQR